MWRCAPVCLVRVLASIACVAVLAAPAAAQPPAQLLVKYRSAVDARKALNAFTAAPSTFAIEGHPATAVPTFAPSRGAFPSPNFLTLSFADSSAAKRSLDALQRDPAVEYAQWNRLHHVDAILGPGFPVSRTKPQPSSPISNPLIPHPSSLNTQPSPNDSAYPNQWNLQKIHMPEAWEIEQGKADVLMAFVDTGIDFDHDDFYTRDGMLGSIHVNPAEDINHDGIFEPWPADSVRMYRGAMRSGDLDGIDQDGNGYVDDVIGYDFVDQAVPNIGDWADRDAVPFDEHSHGTAIAGVLAAQTNNRIGVASVAFGCKVLVVRSLDATGNGEDDDIAAGIIYAADFTSSDGAKVRVINMSFGDVIASPIMHEAIQYATEKGILVVCSSGNNGGYNAHYPSDYPECVSVGASDQDDLVVGTSGGGNRIALVAPGVDIVTTIPGNRYLSANGTSVAAPQVAAAAALVISHQRSLSAADVRGILQTTADDIDDRGWDKRSGSGRLNVAAALGAFAATVQLAEPRQDTGYASDQITVRGSVATPFFAFYRLFAGLGDAPDSWSVVLDTTRKQTLNSVLATWNAAGVPDTSVVMRLVVNTSDGRTIESRARFDLERKAPRFTRLVSSDIILNDKHGILVDARSDQRSYFSVSYRPAGSLEPYRVKAQPEQFTHNHYVILDESDVPPGVPYDLLVEIRNAAGVATSGALAATRAGEAFPTAAFVRKPYALQGSVLLNTATDVFADNGKCVAALDENGAQQLLRVAEFRNGRFDTRDSIVSAFNPRGLGTTRTDGLLQLWTQSGVRSVLFSQATRGGPLLHSIAFADTTSDVRAAGMADFDGDGRAELIGLTDADAVVYTNQGGAYTVLARIPNPTPPPPGEAVNIFSSPVVATGDFDGDGKMELLLGDGDADAFIYEFDPASRKFTQTFVDTNTGQDAFLAAGDFNNDGRRDFAIAFHSPLTWNGDREYDTPFWTVNVFMSDGDNHFRVAWSARLAIVRDPATYRGGLTAGDLDGQPGDELFFNAFPNSYVFRWDAQRQTFAPMQYFPFGATNTAIIADFDGNRVNELGFYTGSQTDFFEYDAARATPPAPLNFTALPLDSTHVTLRWDAVAGATSYVVYRGTFKPSDLTIRIDSFTTVASSQFTDASVQSRSFYAYAVAAVSAAGTSVSTQVVEVYPHPAPRASIASIGRNGVRLRCTELMPQAAQSAAVIRDDRNGLATVITGGDSALVLQWTTALALGRHELHCEHVIDRYGMAVDTSALIYQVVIVVERDSMVLSSTAVPDAHHVVLAFSCVVDSVDARDLAHYHIAPTGSIVAAERDTAHHDHVILTLDNMTPIGALGKSWTIHIDSLRSETCSPIVQGAGSTAGIVLHKEDLSEMFVYPNPCRMELYTHCTFANLTPKAEITIFTVSGARVATVSEGNGDGGVDWNMRDSRGIQVQSGVYLYYATGKNSNGDDVEPKLGKFAIVR